MTGLPEQMAALARSVTGPVAEVADRSWPRNSSAVWEITGAAGTRWFVKRHSSERFHHREVSAYQDWTAALGPGRAPVLAAADSQILAIVISGLPGQIAEDLPLSADDERELHRQAGQLLRRLHDAAPPVPPDNSPGRAVQPVEEHLHRARGLPRHPRSPWCAGAPRTWLPPRRNCRPSRCMETPSRGTGCGTGPPDSSR